MQTSSSASSNNNADAHDGATFPFFADFQRTSHTPPHGRRIIIEVIEEVLAILDDSDSDFEPSATSSMSTSSCAGQRQ
jgi:hypothetical protein